MVVSVTLLAQQPGGSSEDLKRKQAEIQREIDDLRITLKDTKKNTKAGLLQLDRKSTRLNSSHVRTSYAVFCLKKKKTTKHKHTKFPSQPLKIIIMVGTCTPTLSFCSSLPSSATPI